MKENLKQPYRWEERCVLVRDSVWFVPVYREGEDSYIFPGWESFFGNDRPVCMEYCSGNGSWIIEKAQQNPELNWVAVELKFPRVAQIWSKLKSLNLKNLFIVCGEAYMVTSLYIPPQSVAQIFVNFPDPWPKKRHAKHRLLQSRFVAEAARILRPECNLLLVTDDVAYSSWAIKQIIDHPDFRSLYPSPYYIHEYPNYGASYFETLWRSKGKRIYFHKFIRRNANL